MTNDINTDRVHTLFFADAIYTEVSEYQSYGGQCRYYSSQIIGSRALEELYGWESSRYRESIRFPAYISLSPTLINKTRALRQT